MRSSTGLWMPHIVTHPPPRGRWPRAPVRRSAPARGPKAQVHAFGQGHEAWIAIHSAPALVDGEERHVQVALGIAPLQQVERLLALAQRLVRERELGGGEIAVAGALVHCREYPRRALGVARQSI